MEMRMPIEFPYKPSMKTLLLGLLLFGGGAVFTEFKALTNDSGLTIDRIFYLDVDGATTFYSIVVAACLVFVVLALLGVIWSLNGGGRVGLTETELLVSGFRGTHKIPFSSIREARLVRVRTMRHLKIRAGNNRVDINEHWLPAGAFDRVCTAVAQRTKSGPIGK